jgi:ADP-ribose pyrophosphatase YjhB (NUDIX family)
MPPLSREAQFFRAVSERRIVRPRVAAIIVSDDQLLVQRPSDDVNACYAFVGGEYEAGDTFASRLKAEIEEETTAQLKGWQYLFVVENRFQYEGMFIHGLEHYLLAQLDRHDVQSRESHLSFHWLPLNELAKFDLRPAIVRDAVASGEYTRLKHLVVPYDGTIN